MTLRVSKTAAMLALCALAGTSLAACGRDAPEPARNPAPAEQADRASTPDSETVAEDAVLASNNAENAAATQARSAAASTDVDPDSAELTQGEWFVKPDRVMFGPPESEAVFTLACDGSGNIMMTRAITLQQGEGAAMQLIAGSAMASGTWHDAADVMPIAEVSVSASDPVFTAMETADRFAVSAEGHSLLVMPVSGGVKEMIQRCQ